jgi:hypothetical protein
MSGINIKISYKHIYSTEGMEGGPRDEDERAQGFPVSAYVV